MSSGGAVDWIVCPRDSARARIALLCFPWAGVGASFYYEWRRRLPSEIAVLALQLPGRENRIREPAFRQLGPLVDAIVEVLAKGVPAVAGLPIAFFGHSMGALVAHATAHTLRERGLPGPKHLFVSARRAVHLAAREPEDFHALSDDAFLAGLAQRGGPIDGLFHRPELRRLLLPTLRADFELSATAPCSSARPLACGVSAFGGTADPYATRDEIEAWRAHTTASFTARFVPGDHFFVLDPVTRFFDDIVGDLSPWLGS